MKRSIWWRLTPVAFWFTLIGLPVFLGWRRLDWDVPPLVAIPLGLGVAVSNLYLTGFALWHWKFRYRGSHPVAWAAAFPLFWSILPPMLYYATHVIRDTRNRKPYANTEAETETRLPGYYAGLRSAVFVVGGALLGWSAVAITWSAIMAVNMSEKFDRVMARSVGTVLTLDHIQAFYTVHVSYRFLIILMCSLTLCSGSGHLLILFSRRLRLQIKAQEEEKASRETAE